MSGGDGGVQRKESVRFEDFVRGLPRMDGKVVAMTGCTSGIGFVAARTVLQLGATLVMLNRPSLKSEAALALLRDEVDYKLPQLDTPETSSIEERVAAEMAAMRVISVACDLLDFKSVKEAYVDIRTKFPDGALVYGGIGMQRDGKGGRCTLARASCMRACAYDAREFLQWIADTRTWRRSRCTRAHTHTRTHAHTHTHTLSCTHALAHTYAYARKQGSMSCA